MVTVPCSPDDTGHLSIPSLITWEQNAGDATSCQSPPAAWVQPDTKSKCNATVGISIPVSVVGSISVTKLTAPPGSPGSFTFNATGQGATPSSFALGADETQVIATAPLDTTARTYTVTEEMLGGYDPNVQIACLDIDGGTRPDFIAPDPATRSVTIKMSSDGTAGLTLASCFFTNTRLGSIAIIKNAVGGNAAFHFTGSQAFSIATSGGTGQHVLTDLAPGTYTISEIVPAGWDRTALTCSDPTGDTTVADSTATVKLAAGENVTCTFTDTARGSIEIQKQSVGGDATFSFTGSQRFQITTTDGSGGPAVLSNLPVGIYAVSEIVPRGWDLTGLACTDPTNNTATSGSTATIDLGPGETVSCTFTDTRRASISVEKVTAGGDATFAFSGSQSFSIATTSGHGLNTTAFASVVAGAPISIVETVPPGWTLAAATCRDGVTNAPIGTPSGSGVSLTPAAGQKIACTFVDMKLATLRVFKRAAPSSGQSFEFAAEGLTPDTFSLTDDGTGSNVMVFSGLVAGDYTVRETPVAGWVLTDITCSDVAERDLTRRATVDRPGGMVHVHLVAGQRLDCTFTNTRVLPGSITVNKQAVGGDGAFAFAVTGNGTPPTFSITTASDNHVGMETLSGLSAGTYTITETVPTEWDLAPPVSCVVTQGSNTSVAPLPDGVTIELGTTGANTDAVVCQFVDVRRGSVTIAKSASPQSAQAFMFTTSSEPDTTPLPGTFALADSGTPPSSQSFSNLLPGGRYTVTEQVTAGWQLVDIACSGGSATTSDPATGAASVDLQPGEDVTCSYANAQNAAITITKAALGGTAGDRFTFTGDLAGTIESGQSLSHNFPAGTYAISEVIPDGWDLTNIACNGGTVSFIGAGGGPSPAFAPGDTTVEVTIGAGESAACIYTNTRRSSIRIAKRALGGDGAFTFVGSKSFEVVTSGGSGQDATAFAAVAPGTYTVTEIVPTGWHLTAIECTNASATDVATATATVNVAAGEAVTCTFTDARQGSIAIIKRINAAESGTFGFTVPTTLDPAGAFSLTPLPRSSTAIRLFENVAPGTYTIAESSLPAGWQLQGITCTGGSASVDTANRSVTISLDSGQAVACTFDNVTLAALTISVVSVGGTGTFGFDTSGINVGGVDLATFALTTTEDTVKVSRAFGGLFPGFYVFVGRGARGWLLDEVVCIGDTGEVTSDFRTARTAVQLPHGEAIECIYFYSLAASATGEISGTKWNDLNGNGSPDAGEPGLPGWVIHLFRTGDASFHEQVASDANGTYTFPALAPGAYTVCEAPRAGWVQTAPPTGADCSSLPGASGRGYALTVAAGQVLQGNNFGNHQSSGAVAVPTLAEWGTLALMLLLLGTGYTTLRRRRMSET
jgi:hypothetical protein